MRLGNMKRRGLQLKITEAIKTADTEHVVYFLLTAYVETLDYYDPLRSSLPEHVKRLPMMGISDISDRLRAVRGAIEQYAKSQARLLIEEVVEVFGDGKVIQHVAGRLRR